MLSWFERRLDPYPPDPPVLPPRTLLAFCLFYINGAKRWLGLMAVLTALIALSEVTLFGLMGNVVDWLSNADRATFLATEGWKLWAMGAFVLIALPLVIALQSFVIHQVMLGNIPQRVRWLMHRYVIRQSMTYFQDEFAGRIANNVMQTALAVRETVMKLLDVLNYVVVYFLGAVVLYEFSIGPVQGFALFLGISTLLDVFVTYFFTRPFVILLGRSRSGSEVRGMSVASGLGVTAGVAP